MAIGVIFNGPGVTQAQYDQVLREVMPDNQPIPGMLFHVAGPVPGGWVVTEVFESQEAGERFFQEKLGAALQRANINIQPEFFEVHNMIKP